MTSKEYAKRLIDELTEKQTETAVDFLSSFFDQKTLDEIQKERRIETNAGSNTGKIRRDSAERAEQEQL